MSDYREQRKAAWEQAGGDAALLAYIESPHNACMHKEHCLSLNAELAAATARVAELEAALKKANSQAEHFEREWYLRGDALEAATARAESAERDALQRAAEESAKMARKWWSIHCATNKHMETTRKAHDDFCHLERTILALIPKERT